MTFLMNYVSCSYEKTRHIGQGTYGTVFKGRSRVTGEIVAMKEVALASRRGGIPSAVIDEISSLKELKHGNIVDLRDVFFTETKGVLEPSTILSLFKQLLRGVMFCHDRKFYHRDLKPDNLLVNYVDGGWILKIADFGQVCPPRCISGVKSCEVATPGYRAPELLLQCTTYGTAVDIWSIGCIFAEMIGGVPLFKLIDERQEMEHIVSIIGSPTNFQCEKMKQKHPEILIPNELFIVHHAKIPLQSVFPTASREAIALLEAFLKFDPAERITLAQAISHPYCKNAQQWQHIPHISPQTHQQHARKRYTAHAHHQPHPFAQGHPIIPPFPVLQNYPYYYYRALGVVGFVPLPAEFQRCPPAAPYHHGRSAPYAVDGRYGFIPGHHQRMR